MGFYELGNGCDSCDTISPIIPNNINITFLKINENIKLRNIIKLTIANNFSLKVILIKGKIFIIIIYKIS